MTGPSRRTPAEAARRARMIALSCLCFTFAMVGASFAAVPLYRIFCQVTGYGGTTQRAEMASARVTDQEINVRFDANASPGVPWSFQPNERQVRVRLGETRQISYHVRNTSDRTVTAMATFNVTPDLTGAYFNKIQCFCFNNQTLKPGESVDMPVIFFVDPAIADDVDTQDAHTITLSYTFFPAEPPVASVAATKPSGS
jgi:cytochrome c oxidase assembly protein subunit 11